MTADHTIALLLDIEHDDWIAGLAPKQADSLITQAIRAALETLKTAGELPQSLAGRAVEVSAVLTDNDQVQALNRDYRGKDKPTNILSFPQFDADETHAGLPDDAAILLGDLVLAFETVASEAKARDIPIWQHVTHLVIHGLLHLVGFDHVDDNSAVAMEQLEVQAMASIDLDNPYHFDMEQDPTTVIGQDNPATAR